MSIHTFIANEAAFYSAAAQAFSFDLSKKLRKSPEAVREFRRFMILKSLYRDVNSTLLSPSGTVDEVWQAFLLHPVDYVNFCDKILPLDCPDRIIDHNPHGTHETVERKARHRRTIEAYLEFFKETPPPTVWGEVHKTLTETSCKSSKKASTLESSSQLSTKRVRINDGVDKITLQVVWNSKPRHVSSFRLERLSNVSYLKTLIQQTEGVSPNQISLVYAGKDLEDNHTLSYYNIAEGSSVYLVA